MKTRQTVRSILTIAILLCGQVGTWAQTREQGAQLGTEDVVIRWNRVLRETVSTPGQPPSTIMPVRRYAMMPAAMFDAVPSLAGSYAA